MHTKHISLCSNALCIQSQHSASSNHTIQIMTPLLYVPAVVVTRLLLDLRFGCWWLRSVVKYNSCSSSRNRQLSKNNEKSKSIKNLPTAAIILSAVMDINAIADIRKFVNPVII